MLSCAHSRLGNWYTPFVEYTFEMQGGSFRWNGPEIMIEGLV
jgi:hypothetical protein